MEQTVVFGTPRRTTSNGRETLSARRAASQKVRTRRGDDCPLGRPLSSNAVANKMLSELNASLFVQKYNPTPLEWSKSVDKS